jgi:hypothetical protein
VATHLPMKLQQMFRLACCVGPLALSACADDSPGKPGNDGRPDAGSPTDDGGSPLSDGGEPSDEQDAGDIGDGDGDAGDGDAGDGDSGEGPPPPWYENREPFEFSLTGNLQDAFDAAFAGTPDGIFPPVRKKDPFAGTASFSFLDDTVHSEDVTLALRGNSSLQECYFPKLKLTYAERVKDPNNVFFGIKKLKLGTHCGEEDEVNGTIGRLRNERATWREEVVYQLARALGIVIMQTRPAIVTYTDTSVDSPIPAALERKAFLLEHIDELARRLNATALQDPVDCGEDVDARPNATDVLRVKFFHAMIGNWDWTLGPTETGGCGSLMNTEVLVHQDGSLTLVPTDFDLSAFVVGEVRNPDTNQEEPVEAENAKASARFYLDTRLEGETKPAFDAMAAEYLAKKAALLAIVESSQLDADGKKVGKLLLEGFFAVLAEP